MSLVEVVKERVGRPSPQYYSIDGKKVRGFSKLCETLSTFSFLEEEEKTKLLKISETGDGSRPKKNFKNFIDNLIKTEGTCVYLPKVKTAYASKIRKQKTGYAQKVSVKTENGVYTFSDAELEIENQYDVEMKDIEGLALQLDSRIENLVKDGDIKFIALKHRKFFEEKDMSRLLEVEDKDFEEKVEDKVNKRLKVTRPVEVLPKQTRIDFKTEIYIDRNGNEKLRGIEKEIVVCEERQVIKADDVFDGAGKALRSNTEYFDWERAEEFENYLRECIPRNFAWPQYEIGIIPTPTQLFRECLYSILYYNRNCYIDNFTCYWPEYTYNEVVYGLLTVFGLFALEASILTEYRRVQLSLQVPRSEKTKYYIDKVKKYFVCSDQLPLTEEDNL